MILVPIALTATDVRVLPFEPAKAPRRGDTVHGTVTLPDGTTAHAEVPAHLLEER